MLAKIYDDDVDSKTNGIT